MEYLIITEKTATGYSGYAPDLPGCIASGASASEVRSLMREGIEFHLEGLRLGGFPVPPPSSEAVFFPVSSWAGAGFLLKKIYPGCRPGLDELSFCPCEYRPSGDHDNLPDEL